MPPPCFLLSPSAVKITDWGFHELHYPSVALKAFEHNSQLMVNSALLPGVRRVLLGYSTAHSLGSVMAKGKLCLNYFIIIFLQCLRPTDFSVEANFLISRSCIAKRVEQCHCLGEERDTSKQFCHPKKDDLVLVHLFQCLCCLVAGTCSSWDGGEEEGLHGKCRVSGSITSWMDEWP